MTTGNILHWAHCTGSTHLGSDFVNSGIISFYFQLYEKIFCDFGSETKVAAMLTHVFFLLPADWCYILFKCSNSKDSPSIPRRRKGKIEQSHEYIPISRANNITPTLSVHSNVSDSGWLGISKSYRKGQRSTKIPDLSCMMMSPRLKVTDSELWNFFGGPYSQLYKQKVKFRSNFAK